MKNGRIFIDSFSAGLDEMKREHQADESKVLAALQAMPNKRYSIFEVTANQTIARTMTNIVKRGLIETLGGAYPWTTFQITPAGKAIIDAAKGA